MAIDNLVFTSLDAPLLASAIHRSKVNAPYGVNERLIYAVLLSAADTISVKFA